VSFWAKAAHLAPVILATGAAIGLFVIKVDDPRTKRIIRIIAILLGIGTTFSIVTQVPVVLAAIEEGYKAGIRVLGLDEESQLARIRKAAEIEAARAKAESETQAAKAKAEAERLAHQRRIEEEKHALERALRKAKEDAEIARLDAERRLREEAKARQDAERERQLQALRDREERDKIERQRRQQVEAERARRTEWLRQYRAQNFGCDPGYRSNCSDNSQAWGCPCARD
jgi:hypothetical protein